MAVTNQPAPGPRGRGRPAVGRRVHFHCPPETLAQVDQIAADADMDRAEVIRELLATALLGKRPRTAPAPGRTPPGQT